MRHPETVPQVFIIESLRLGDEKAQRFEGRVLSQILRLSGKKSIYYYIRTQRELERLVKIFTKSTFRYLHISCHGNSEVMATTLDTIDFPELGRILRPSLGGRRVFLSACEMVNSTLAKELLRGTGCHSVIGPAESILFGDAALFWSSFYHLMFKRSAAAMKRKWMLTYLRRTATLFRVRMNYFSSSRTRGDGFRLAAITPS